MGHCHRGKRRRDAFSLTPSAATCSEKSASIQESHAGPPGYHFLGLWALFWPAAALLPAGAIDIWRNRESWQGRFLLSWVVPTWIVFELSATKLPHYAMPLYPALAIIAAHAASAAVTQTAPLARRAGAVIYSLVGLIGASLVALLPLLLQGNPLTLLPLTAGCLIALASLLIGFLFWRGRSYVGGCAAASLAALYAWTVMTGVLPGLSTLAISPRLSTALALSHTHPLQDEASPVVIAGYAEPSAVFLLGTQTVLTTGDDAAPTPHCRGYWGRDHRETKRACFFLGHRTCKLYARYPCCGARTKLLNGRKNLTYDLSTCRQ